MACYFIIGVTPSTSLLPSSINCLILFSATNTTSLEAFFIRAGAVLLKVFTPVLAASLPA